MEFVLTHPDLGVKQILVIFDGVPYEADSTHRWWNEIVQLCIADDPRVLDLFPDRSVQQPSEEIALPEDPPFTSRVGGVLRPENRILVDHFVNNGYTLQGMVEAEGYTLDDLHVWMDADPSLYPELREAIEKRRHQIAFPDRSEEPRWLPTNVEPVEDEEEEARAESREAEYTAHEIIEEGS